MNVSQIFEAGAALPVPETLMKTMTEYSREPADLYAWRNRMADLIERAGVPEVNPWGQNFGVRGFSAPAKPNPERRDATP